MKRRILPIVLAFLFIINLSALAALAYNRWLRSPASFPQESPGTLEALQEPIGLDQRQLQQMKGLRGALEDEIASILVQIQQNRQWMQFSSTNSGTKVRQSPVLYVSALPASVMMPASESSCAAFRLIPKPTPREPAKPRPDCRR